MSGMYAHDQGKKQINKSDRSPAEKKPTSCVLRQITFIPVWCADVVDAEPGTNFATHARLPTEIEKI